MKLTVISGTNRPQSMTKKVASYVAQTLKEQMGTASEVVLLDLEQLPLEIFTPEAYSKKPGSFKPFVDAVVNTNGILTVLPEYNGGFPGALKYFIDMLPFPQSLQKMPSAFIGVSEGRFGAFRPVEQVQQIFAYRNAYLFPERVFIPSVSKSIDENGKPKDAFVSDLLDQQLRNFIKFCETIKIS